MIELIKITIQKKKNVEGKNKPTYDIVALDKDYQNKTYIGSLWVRETEDGNKFLSGQLSEEREYEGKKYEGYMVITKKEYRELLEAKKQLSQVEIKTGGYEGDIFDGSIIDDSQIPF